MLHNRWLSVCFWGWDGGGGDVCDELMSALFDRRVLDVRQCCVTRG